MSQPIYKIYNDETRRHEEIDLDEAELVPGQTVVKMYWSNTAEKYVTVPGASLYRVSSDLQLEPDND